MPHLVARQAGQPTFPDQPASCPICAQNYAGIDSCAQAAPMLANVSMVIFNPGAFVDVIKCACADTFQSAYPQCVDCFEKTNQTSFLNTTDTNSVLSGINSICALASTLIGGAPSADGEVTPTSSAGSTPTTVSSAASLRSIPGVYSAISAIAIIVATLQ
ncbi:hypothetical protein PHLGIDRAFT_111344 [Phlebiopsis gigantea 11061_1 CR5-6]|uniref:Uncharacterized protein n=1 Tax=Phlebiopsis gigantea (strain 11061_1 CR5-6) TaxID=745531 RepID=A0A0C3S1A9_PHLG1|nr:hypothetical protein PHLGIDRAFT_111344 [Phlebiopsis gigantea 11061_1 CR5-6]